MDLAVGLSASEKSTGDRKVLAAELAAHGPALLALARYLVGDDAEARDLAQQTLEIGLRRLNDLRDPSKLGPWLTSIEAREAFRTRRRLLRFVRLDSAVGELPATAGPDEQAVALRDAVKRLPSRVRAAVALHHMAGLSVEETAAAMSISPNTVKSHLKTGLRRLREILDE